MLASAVGAAQWLAAPPARPTEPPHQRRPVRYTARSTPEQEYSATPVQDRMHSDLEAWIVVDDLVAQRPGQRKAHVAKLRVQTAVMYSGIEPMRSVYCGCHSLTAPLSPPRKRLPPGRAAA